MDFNRIVGQEHCKRGLEVALTGNHSVMLIGCHGAGKSILKKATHSVNSLLPVNETLPCPCGNFTDPKNECNCKPIDIHVWVSKILPCDICLDVPKLNYKEIAKRRGESSQDIIKRILRNKCLPRPTELDKDAEELLKLAILELGISAKAYDTIINIASTIAQMDISEIIKAHHISEAISYRSLDRNLWG